MREDLLGIYSKYVLVCKLLPAVIFEMAANINGVTSLPLMPFSSAILSASAIELFMTSSAKVRI
jgi:hypothetical protein